MRPLFSQDMDECSYNAYICEIALTGSFHLWRGVMKLWKCVNISIHTLCVLVLSNIYATALCSIYPFMQQYFAIFMQQKNLFWFDFELIWVQPCLFGFHQWSRKPQPHNGINTFLPHAPTLFIMLHAEWQQPQNAKCSKPCFHDFQTLNINDQILKIFFSSL